MSVVKLESVDKVFNLGEPNEFKALQGITLEIEPKTITVIAGPSGSGKTTLLSIIGLMSRPTAGRVTILGKETTLLSERFRTIFRRRHIGFLFQEFNLIPDLKASENLKLVLYPEGPDLRQLEARTSLLLKKFGILEKAHIRTSILSGGEKQRLALARALIADPEILLVDEPTAHLDTKLSLQLIEDFKKLRKEGKTLIIASHDPLIVEGDLPDRVEHMVDGRIVKH